MELILLYVRIHALNIQLLIIFIQTFRTYRLSITSKLQSHSGIVSPNYAVCSCTSTTRTRMYTGGHRRKFAFRAKFIAAINHSCSRTVQNVARGGPVIVKLWPLQICRVMAVDPTDKGHQKRGGATEEM